MELLDDVLLTCILQEHSMEATIEAFHGALGADLDQVEVEVDKERIEERHDLTAVLGVRFCNENSDIQGH